MGWGAKRARDVDRVAAAEVAGRGYALLADGTTMTITQAGPEDYQAVLRLHVGMSGHLSSGSSARAGCPPSGRLPGLPG